MALKKSTSFYFIVGMLFLLIISGMNFFYYKNGFLEKEIDNHMKSIIELKYERINDYFIERKNDLDYLASMNEIENMVYSPLTSEKDIVYSNILKKMDVISKQFDIYLEKYPNTTIEEINESDFNSILIQKIGTRGSTYLLNEKEMVLGGGEFGDVNHIFPKKYLIQNESYYLGGYAYFEDFLFSNLTETKTLDLFFDNSDYSKLYFISSEGRVIYDSTKGEYLGVELEKINSSDLSKTYYLSKFNINQEIIYGPYKNPNFEYYEINFIKPVTRNDLLLGYVVIVDKMNKINEISLEDIMLLEKSNFYIVNQEFFLITPIKGLPDSVLVQKIETTNTQNCIEDLKTNYFSTYLDYSGNLVIGNYKKIDKANWCLLSEVPEKDLYSKLNFSNLIKYYLIILLIFALVLFLGLVFLTKTKFESVEEMEWKKIIYFGIFAFFLGLIGEFIFHTFFNLLIQESYTLLFFVVKMLGLVFCFYGFLNKSGGVKWILDLFI